MTEYRSAASRALAGHFSRIMRTTAGRVAAWSIEGRPVGPHIMRYTMYRRLEATGRELGLRTNPPGRVLSISGSERLCTTLGVDGSSITTADFPAFDLRDLPFADGSFDVLVADQVLEHIEADPSVAVNESFRVVRQGGLVVHTTCFVNPIHDELDFFRFTPAALSMLFAPHGEIVDVGGWGNRIAWLVEALGLRFHPVPHDPRHPLHKAAVYDEPDWPIVTWAVARKR